MSGKQGFCIKCNEYSEGVYCMDVIRGWAGDKYNFHVEICEECLSKITSGWKLEFGDADETYIKSRHETKFMPDSSK